MANTKSTANRTRAAGARGSAAPRKGKQAKAPDPETRRDFFCILFFGLAALMLLIACMRPDEYSSLYAIRQTASGLTGFMTLTVPLAFAWAGLFAYRSGGDKNQIAKFCLLIAAFELCALGAVEAFYCADITLTMGIQNGYVNFLNFAYRAHTGGGLLGALLGWPLFRMLTKWGAALTCVMLMLLILIGMRILSIRRLGERMSQGIQTYRDNHPPREKAPREPKPPREKAESGSFSNMFPLKTSPARKKTAPARLYEEDISLDGVDTDAPVVLPKLRKEGARRELTPIKPPENDFTIPEVAPGTVNAYAEKPPEPRAKKGARKPAPLEETPLDIEKIDLMRAVREESEDKRNADYVNNALRDHARKPKPVLTFSLEDKKRAEAAEANMKPAPEVAPAPQPPKTPAPERARAAEKTTAPAKTTVEADPPAKAPAAPKPSFFDAPEKAAKPKDEKPAPAAALPRMPRDEKADNGEAPEYDFPPIDLMEAGTQEKTTDGYDAVDMQRAETLVKTLQSFSIPVKITGISHGPAVTRFEMLPAPGIKVSRITSYADDLAMNLAAVSVRIEAPIPGKSAVGVEVPNVKKEIVHLRDVLESQEARKAASRLAVGLGKDNSGKYIVADLASMPHVLIAGQTGSGKSVCINAIIISILFRATPEEVRMILIDPKMVELNAYNTIPHLLVPVVTDPKKAASALDWAVAEMTRRYKEFAAHGAKNIQSYNLRLPPDEKPMPQIVLIVDELADLMMTAPRDVEDAINRLAQLARAAGIHLVIATQRPSVDIITGVIKANIPTRIAFTVASGVDSRTILDSYGAEKLLGRGDMLYLPPDRNKPLRIQGAWVSENEVQAVVDYVSETHGTDFDEDILEHMENAVLSDAEKHDKAKEEEDDGVDELFAVAVKSVVDAGQASISMLQRKLRVGYARAGRLIDEMAARGLVSQSEGSKSREVLITREQYRMMFGDDDPIDAPE